MEHINRIKAAAVGVLGCLTALWGWFGWPVSYTHLRAHDTLSNLVCRILLE